LAKVIPTPQQNIVEEFIKLISDCRGQVTFVNDEGERLIANSMLSTLVGFSTVLSVAEKLEMRLECEYQQDYDRITAFLTKYKLGRPAVG
jgi:hypothetical protein